jgi:hypothetical protein
MRPISITADSSADDPTAVISPRNDRVAQGGLTLLAEES